MKKLIAMLLCFAMIAAFGVSTAFAALPDAKSAAAEIQNGRDALAWAKGREQTVKDYDRIINYLKAYEAVKYDSTKTEDDVVDALAKVKGQLNNLGYSWIDPDTNTSTVVSTWKTNLQNNIAYAKAFAEAREIWKNYYLSSGTKMDENTLAIARAKHDAAYDLVNAQTAAATAKTNAIKAQATAKTLINDAIKAAQDAAATAVANAQADAYKQLSDNYADAVEAFWAEVEAAWF